MTTQSTFGQGLHRVPGPSRGRVLIIDDEAEIRESLELLLGMEGYEVDLAENGIEGEKKFDQRAYDLILLDLMMPLSELKNLVEALRKITAR